MMGVSLTNNGAIIFLCRFIATYLESMDNPYLLPLSSCELLAMLKSLHVLTRIS